MCNTWLWGIRALDYGSHVSGGEHQTNGAVSNVQHRPFYKCSRLFCRMALAGCPYMQYEMELLGIVVIVWFCQ